MLGHVHPLHANSVILAIQVPRPQQFREADQCSQGLCLPRPSSTVLFLGLLQHWWRVPGQFHWLHPSGLLFDGSTVQCKQG